MRVSRVASPVALVLLLLYVAALGPAALASPAGQSGRSERAVQAHTAGARSGLASLSARQAPGTRPDLAGMSRAQAPVARRGQTLLVQAQAGPAQVPSRLYYQGRLWNEQTREWVSGYRTLVFRLYETPTGGAALWTGTETNVMVRNGLLQVDLDIPQGHFTGRDLWLEVQVDGDAEPMLPRTQLLPAPYALSLVPGATIDGHSRTATLRVFNDGAGAGPGDAGSHGIQATSGFTGTAGVYGFSAFGYGVRGVSSQNVGVFGFAGRTRTPPLATGHYGVYGLSESAAGIYGRTTATQSPAIVGEGVSMGLHGVGMTGVYGEGDVGVKGEGTVGVSGAGTVGVSATGTGAAVSAEGDQVGVSAEGGDVGLQATGGMVGVSGTSRSTDSTGIGVQGQATGKASAVKGNSDAGFAGSFWSKNSIAVYGISNPSAVGLAVSGRHGVYGQGGNASDAYGGYFVGTNGVLGREAPDSASGLAGRFEGDVTITDALVVEGPATFRGSKSGYVVDICQSDDLAPLRRGDVVVVTGVATPLLGDIPTPRVRRSAAAGEAGVIGIVDRHYVPGKEGSPPGYSLQAVATGEYLSVVTLGAFASVCADASYGAIAAGDLLVTAPTPGCVMRSAAPAPGTLVGKALGSLAVGRGALPILVTLQ